MHDIVSFLGPSEKIIRRQTFSSTTTHIDIYSKYSIIHRNFSNKALLTLKSLLATTDFHFPHLMLTMTTERETLLSARVLDCTKEVGGTEIVTMLTSMAGILEVLTDHLLMVNIYPKHKS